MWNCIFNQYISIARGNNCQLSTQTVANACGIQLFLCALAEATLLKQNHSKQAGNQNFYSRLNASFMP